MRLLVSKTVGGRVSVPHANVEVIPNIGLSSLRATLRHAKAYRPNIIYERRFSPKLGSIVSLLTRVPYFLEINGLPEYEGAPSRSAVVRGMGGRFMRPAYRVAKRIIVPSERLADLLGSLLSLPRRSFSVIQNGVDLSLFEGRDRTAARRLLGLPLNKKIVVYVGKLAAWQGLETLVDCAQHLGQISEIHVLLVGDGPLRESLLARIATKHLDETVGFTGPVPHEKIPTFLAAADVCVAPFSRSRNDLVGISPIKLFEYLAAGRSVVASDVSGVREIVQDAGILVAPDSATALASAISDLLSDSARLTRLEKRAAELAAGNSWEDRARAILDVVRLPPDSTGSRRR